MSPDSAGDEPSEDVSSTEGTASATGGHADDRPSSLVEALEVRHNAKVGVVVGAVFAAVLYLQRPADVVWEFSNLALYYLSLAFVAGASAALVVATALCAKTGLDPVLDRTNWLRRGGTAAAVGGLLWITLPAFAVLTEAGVVAERVWVWATVLAALALAVGVVGLHAAVRDASGSVELGASVVTLVALLLAAANATASPAPVVETSDGAFASPFLLAAVVAAVTATPLAITAHHTRRFREWGPLGLLAGLLVGVVLAAWLVGGGGWAAVASRVDAATAVALAAITVPTGVGWLLAGLALRERAAAIGDASDASGRDVARRTTG